jgi:cytochrome b
LSSSGSPVDATTSAPERVRAWDLPTRIFHWLFVTLIVCGYVSRYYGDSDFVWHKWNGYAVLILVVFRLIWGFVGCTTARFASFFPTPRSMLRYGLSIFGSKTEHYLGHNPVGGAMILALLAVVFAQAVTGLFNSNDILFDAPFVKLVSEHTVKLAGVAHHYIFELILLLASIHILANLFYHFVKREPLIAAMVTGHKPAEEYLDCDEAEGGSLWRALICLLVAAVLVLGTIRLLGGEL